MSFNPELHTTMQEIVGARISILSDACKYAESVISDANALVMDAGAEIQHTIRPQVEAVAIEPEATVHEAPAEQGVTGNMVVSLEMTARAAAAQQATHVNFEQLLIDAQRDAA